MDDVDDCGLVEDRLLPRGGARVQGEGREGRAGCSGLCVCVCVWGSDCVRTARAWASRAARLTLCIATTHPGPPRLADAFPSPIQICLDSAQCDPREPRVAAFLRMLIKLPEHTYGFPNFDDSTHWTNADFHAAVAAKEPAYLNTLASYTEQRDIAAREGLRYLGDHPLAANISARVAALVPSVPDVSKLVPVARAAWAAPFTATTPAGAVTLGFDGVTGALSRAALAGVEWAGPSNLLAQYVYKTYNDTDLDAQGTCCYGVGGRQKAANPQRTTTAPTMTGMWLDDPAAPRTAVVAMSMPDALHTAYGAPAALWLTATVADDASVHLDVQAFNKTATRLAEAHFLSFRPAPVAGGDYVWLSACVCGGWVHVGGRCSNLNPSARHPRLTPTTLARSGQAGKLG